MFQDSQHIYPCVFTCMVCGGGRSKLLQYSGAASNSCALRHKMMISHPGTLCIDSLHVSSTAIRSLRHTLNSVAQGSQSCDLLCYDPNTQHGQEETHCCLLPKIQTRALGHIINNSSGFPIQLIYYKNTTLQSETPLAKDIWIRDDGLPQRTQWTVDEPLQLSEGGSTHTALLFCAPEASRLSCAVHMMHSKPRFETPKPTIPCES